MQKKKIWSFTIISLILISIVVIDVIFLVPKKPIEKPIIEPITPNMEPIVTITAKQAFADYQYKDCFQNYYFVTKNGYLGAIDENGNTVLDFKYPQDAYLIKNNSAITINTEDKSYLFDNNLKLIITSSSPINPVIDPINQEIYYSINNTLFNTNQEIIKTNLPSYLKKIGSYIFTDHKIINLNNDNYYDIDFFSEDENYIYALSSNKETFYYYDYKNQDFQTYQVTGIFTNGYSLKKGDDKYSFVKNHGLTSQDTEVNINNYRLDYKACSYGFKIYVDNQPVNNTCYDDYSLSNNASAISIIKNENNYLLYDSKLEKIKDEVAIVGKYLTNFDYNKNYLHITDYTGQEVKNPCTNSLEYYDDLTYICQDETKAFFVDNNFQQISPSYDSIHCLPDTNYCIYRQNKKFGILFNKDVLVEPIYQNIQFTDDNKIIAQHIFGFDTFSLTKTTPNNSLSKAELKSNIAYPYNNINVLDTIDKYNLTDLKNLILANEEFFKKYTYIVENNSNLGNYKKQVMNLFKEVILNKSNLDENIFLTALEKLNIVKKDKLIDELANGLYYDSNKKIELLVDNDNVVYHELTHFVDLSLNDFSNNIYQCENTYFSQADFANMNREAQNKCELAFDKDIYFLSEGGAEYYSAYYLNHNIINAYQLPTKIIGALSYIYGFDFIKDIYFDSQNGNLKFLQLFLNAGLTYSDFKQFLNITDSSTFLEDKNYFVITDTLIKLYESQHSSAWNQDLEFSEIIAMIIGYTKIKPEYTENYLDYQKLNFDFLQKYRNMTKNLKEIDFQQIKYYPGYYLKGQSASYLILEQYDSQYNSIYKIINYDFQNKKIIDIQSIPFNE